MKRVTIADVAARAGVSKSTVSHALSGKRPVATETRERIQQAIAQLGYRPSPVAQRLAGGNTRTIGYVYPLYVPHIAGLEMKFITSTANVCNEANYAFMMLTHPIDDVNNLERFAASGLVDGFILMQVQMEDPRVQLLQSTGTPFVLVGRCADNYGITYVDLDVTAAIEQCIAHLADLGHKEIAYLHQHDLAFGFAHRATSEFERACRRRGVTPHAHACDASQTCAAEVMQQLLEEERGVTAVIAWNSIVAWSAIRTAQEYGRHVPQDLAVIAFGHADLAPHAPLQLTVLDIHPEKMAAQAAHMLLDKLTHEGADEVQILIPPKLIVRESTAVRT